MSRSRATEGWFNAAEDAKPKPDGSTVEVEVVEGHAVVGTDGVQRSSGVVEVLATDAARYSRRGWVKPAPRKAAPRKRK